MGDPWIDFAGIKEQASFSTILRRYNIAHGRSCGQVSVCCPFHDDHNPSMSVSMEDKLFHCFTCGAAGDVFQFVRRMENVPTIGEAAKIVADICGISRDGQKPSAARPTVVPIRDARSSRKKRTFDGELSLDSTHPYLDARGLTPELIQFFGLGYCATGFLKGRICIPIHSPAGGRIEGYAGRWASDDVPEGVSRYLFTRGFPKRTVLFNYHRVMGREHLIIVEGFWSVFRLHALGWSAIALMGRSLSEEQEILLSRSGIRSITLLLDGDEPGRSATEKLLPRLSQKFFTHVSLLRDGDAPDEVAEDLLLKALYLE